MSDLVPVVVARGVVLQPGLDANGVAQLGHTMGAIQSRRHHHAARR